jgi:hypothetical protein
MIKTLSLSVVANLDSLVFGKHPRAAGRNFVLSALLLGGLSSRLQAASDFGIPSGMRVVVGSIELTVPEAEPEIALPQAVKERTSTSRKFSHQDVAKAPLGSRPTDSLTLRGDFSGSSTSAKDVLSLGVQSGGGTTALDQTVRTGPPHPFSVGAEVGILSFFSGSVAWRFSDHFGLRGGFNRFGYKTSEDLDDVSYSLKLKMQSQPLLLDVHPWSERSFRLSFGVLFNQNQFSASANPTADVEIGNTTYTPAQVGSLNLSVKQRAVSPYLGMGGNLFYFDSTHQWAFTHEVGVAWTGKPKVSLSASGAVPQADLENERQKISDDISKLVILPIIKFGINYSF